jgi:hypothetical protein
MTRDWEPQFRLWAKPPGKTEEQRCENAISAIRNAVNGSEKLRNRDITIFCQGSYRNNTNVRKDSDVDVGILCKDTFFYDELPEQATPNELGILPANYSYEQFKNDVGEALSSYFGGRAVTRGNKAFDVHETSYHVDADVAPFFEHRRYYNVDGDYLKGVEMRTDNGLSVINWPEHHYENGVRKNKDTGMRYKSIIRVLKALSNEMTEAKVRAGSIPGFLIECLVWNVPDECFQNPEYTDDVREALLFTYENTKNDKNCDEWGEVSELKYLFRGPQKWTRAQANDFAVAAWNYVGLKRKRIWI